MNRFSIFFSWISLPIIACAWSPVTTETSVRVTDPEGMPIQDAKVKIVYRQQVVTNYDIGEGFTDKNGEFSYEGKAFDRVSVYIEKEGYYDSMYRASVYKANTGVGKEFLDPEIEAILKPIVNPVPMYARGNWSVDLMKIGEPVGFDLIKNDWIAPHGNGTTADLVFNVDGYYKDYYDQNSTLTLTFSNPGDGFIAFRADSESGSRLLSPLEAPEDGYEPVKHWHKFVQKIEGDRPIGSPEYRKNNPFDEEINYIIRVRTVLDADGNVESALYGKIYGDILFGGASDEGSFIRAKAYYLNPTPNDRGLEFAVGSSLFDNLNRFDTPHLP